MMRTIRLISLLLVGVILGIWLAVSLNQSCVGERRWFCLADPIKTPLPNPANEDQSADAEQYLFTIPPRHVQILMTQGFTREEIFLVNQAFERHRDTFAYQRFSSQIPLEDLYLLALYASAVVGGGFDPRLTVGIHRNEIIHQSGVGFTVVGECAFVSDKKGHTSLVRGASAEESELVRNRFRREFDAFQVIFENIKAHIHPGIRKSYLRASCGAGALGSMQIMPTNWDYYQEEVCREVCAVLGVEYASPFHLIPAIFGATALLRDKARYLGIN